MNESTTPGRMVMTMLEAHVDPDRWADFEQVYSASSGRLPSQMVQTFLVQSTADPSIWRAISVWQSREALEEYRRSVETPGGVLLFRAVGAEPQLTIFDVAAALHPAN